MANYKLLFDEDFEEPFELIAIHCSEEDYKLAYLMNRNLNMRLKRSKTDLDFSSNGLLITFPLYEFEDVHKYTHFYLVANKCKSVEAGLQSSDGLFAEMLSEKSRTHYLLPEYKKVDYFLKIFSDFETESLHKIISEINDIKQVISAYSVAIDNIKSKNNLIFD
ncbi:MULTISPECIES: IPExxxVDY family protein [Aequorivita]|uniref:IPExxxVDY family protein n=2 Tax=Aequorivita TaxID=153265 RepID=A0AB35YP15_9FLAO|nr:IPExxxVDY family protein [Aequorivita sp. Ant34-E75]WGF93549.1 IPExxxVDY family protein [Aequorivita sp. Ant34-E75]